MSFIKGQIPWNKGIPRTDNEKKNISLSKKGKLSNSPTKFKKNDSRLVGNKFAEGNKPNQTSFKKGEHRSSATEFKKGIIPKNKGIKTVFIKCKICNGEVADNRSKICRKCFKGKNHCQWLGGKSFELYTNDWTKTLKQLIRERDKYICKVCKKLQKKELFCVHHIDYNKKNCNPDNLITLCRSCHVKTNCNRNYWIKYFKTL